MRPEKQRHGRAPLRIEMEWQSSAQKCKGAVQRSLVEWREATVLQGYVMRGKGLALQRIVLQRNGSGKPCLERYRNEE